jgi:hypothetical protein
LPFWLFCVAMLAQFMVVWRYFPETRGVALEQVETTMARRGDEEQPGFARP